MAASVEKLAYWLLIDVNRAVRVYALLPDDGRAAVAVSGGKDSLSLLKLFDIRRNTAPEKYDLTVLLRAGLRGNGQN